MQNDTWATRVNNIKDEDDKSDKDLSMKLGENNDFVPDRTEAMKMRRGIAEQQSYGYTMENQGKRGAIKDTSANFGQSKEEISSINQKLIQLTKIIQEIREKQDCETMSLKKEMATLKEVVEVNDLRSLKPELKGAIQAQKDAAKEVSGIKGQLNMLYGRKFFDHKQ